MRWSAPGWGGFGGGRDEMGTYMLSREGWKKAGRRGLRRDRRKDGMTDNGLD